MPPVRAAHGGNPRCVARRRKPVVNCRSDLAAVDGRLAGAVVAGNEQHDPVPACDGLLEGPVDRAPRLIEIVTVEVEDTIGFDIARPELAVPTAIQRQTRRGSSRRGGSSSADRRFDDRRLCDRLLGFS
jgi:hypothetical protein